ncbi:hypothetical protein CL628_01320 [bacterium]|nr:hypothetical protein [bacterium]
MEGTVWRPYERGLGQALALQPSVLDLSVQDGVTISTGGARLRFVLPSTISAQVIPGGTAVVLTRGDEEADLFIARVSFAGGAQLFWKVDLITLAEDDEKPQVANVCMIESDREAGLRIAAVL